MPRQVLAMTWDFAECNPLGKSSGDGLAGLLGGLTGDKAPAKTPETGDPSTTKKKSDKLTDLLGGLLPR